ncbi:MAG: hypothetical protein PHW24_02745, partial [Candidatus Moranbacteria bacterium]|nr:hypothetical protein [Candidatus Moranbacteria bacterium]
LKKKVRFPANPIPSISITKSSRKYCKCQCSHPKSQISMSNVKQNPKSQILKIFRHLDLSHLLEIWILSFGFS